jgi:GTP-binding protein Era
MMNMISFPSNYKSGFVALMGPPNVGKSTLMNAVLGEKIAAVSPWPQTTRQRQMGILTLENAQIIFVDTPGIHHPLHKLGEYMNEEAKDVLHECDLTMLVLDVSHLPNEEDLIFAKAVGDNETTLPAILVLNKVDLIDETVLVTHQSAYLEILPLVQDSISISATHGDNLDKLISLTIIRLPESPPFFPPDQLTDLYERDIAADLIRESVIFHLRDEVPHSVAIRIDEYIERNHHGAYIAATLFVERDSQKGIIIGQGGNMLKKIGIAARKEIEAMSGRKVYLQLRVKVRKNWRNDEAALKLFGFGHSKVK